MRPGGPGALSISQLVDRFVEIAKEQEQAELFAETGKMKRLFWQMEAVEAELKSRNKDDERRALLPLLDYPNRQVQLKAALATVALAPAQARAMLEALQADGIQPQALEAGMALWALDEGIFKPT